MVSTFPGGVPVPCIEEEVAPGASVEVPPEPDLEAVGGTSVGTGGM